VLDRAHAAVGSRKRARKVKVARFSGAKGSNAGRQRRSLRSRS
jgi:hypothetical protein